MHHVCLIQSISARKATHIKLGTRSGSSQCQLHFGTKMVSIGWSGCEWLPSECNNAHFQAFPPLAPSAIILHNGYNGYNGGWPSARLFGWSAADWSRPATYKSISTERKRKSIVFCWERKLWTSWLLTCCSKKGWVAEKSSKKGVNRKEKCFFSSQTRWSWQNKRACTSFWTCSSSPGHWLHTQEPS